MSEKWINWFTPYTNLIKTYYYEVGQPGKCTILGALSILLPVCVNVRLSISNLLRQYSKNSTLFENPSCFKVANVFFFFFFFAENRTQFFDHLQKRNVFKYNHQNAKHSSGYCLTQRRLLKVWEREEKKHISYAVGIRSQIPSVASSSKLEFREFLWSS